MPNILETYEYPTSENTALLGKTLPNLSFVEFDAWKLKNAEIYWINEELISEYGISIKDAEKQILDNFSYVSEGYTSKEHLDLSDKKVFLADRYGSQSEVCNGGSARCGSNGNFQVKGMGKNPLVSVNVDYEHSHGKMTLIEAIHEAVWGEICHNHLPYGAVRTLAIINNNINIEYKDKNGNIEFRPCALAIRETSIRPAHFERATYFWPAQEYSGLRSNDYLRVEQSIAYMEVAFCINEKDKKEFGPNLTQTALYSFMRRFAKQMAVSRIKGIPHGSLTSSNIALDGRFLDFGTISAVPDFGNYLLAAGQSAVWDDHNDIVLWINNLCFYLNKYSNEKLSKQEQGEALKFFLSELEDAENIETAIQFGLLGSDAELKKTGLKIKTLLRKNKQKAESFKNLNEGSFENFKLQAQSVAKELNINSANINFELRKIKYYRYEIEKEKFLFPQSNSRKAIADLISSYSQQEIVSEI